MEIHPMNDAELIYLLCAYPDLTFSEANNLLQSLKEKRDAQLKGNRSLSSTADSQPEPLEEHSQNPMALASPRAFPQSATSPM